MIHRSLACGAVKAVLGLGANLGDPADTFRKAAKAIANVDGVTVTAAAPLYVSRPWGKTDQPDFTNSALLIETQLSPRRLLAALLEVEKELGRIRAEPWGPRVIDIDILVYGEELLAEPELSIPHPHLTERSFALKPLVDLWPTAKIGERPASEILARLDLSDLTPAGAGNWHREPLRRN
ncbi:2-amino-4-hydroxy-6-hydroxymethyldihydropteridine diphosphokinase [Afifella sp. JA880]|uniref:2-amino-4-hydroxy-6- hydroxymethyldihydropteridine diphosphokinase n=1 Tax=Afifella sp. JA880 TaxID=2975280 RepID=UPI0021BB1E13|nr:2-amino-4-hydroxy-6-hydroxymethyldihydropteridine diphosphokinase [Afifella sp. JA880]MCT8269030.1 2-amino-4-hydroxy-6-hydroxymethyldihydropteridine diphosphokinase [Afifella sp. JA880]